MSESKSFVLMVVFWLYSVTDKEPRVMLKSWTARDHFAFAPGRQLSPKIFFISDMMQISETECSG